LEIRTVRITNWRNISQTMTSKYIHSTTWTWTRTSR